jgi:acyl carrier protein
MDNDSSAAILEQLTEVARDVFMDDTLELKRSDWADDIVGWSSITLVELLIGVQERFEIALNAEETDNLKSIGDLADVVQRKLPPR